MNRYLIVLFVGAVIAFASGASADLWEGFIHRHEASASDAVYLNGVAIEDVKVIYIRDNAAPDTCTQLIVISATIHAVSADAASCRF